MARLTPPTSARGVFQLKAPFVADVKTAYSVSAIRSFAEIISRGTDPMVLVYTPVGLAESFYEKDVAEGAMIVTLVSAKGQQIYVPDTYIASYPNMGDVDYTQTILAVSLGALPVAYDTTAIENDIANVVKDLLGVSPEVKVARSPILDTITSEEHTQLVAARQGTIAARDDESVRIRDLEAQLAIANERIALYEQYINGQTA